MIPRTLPDRATTGEWATFVRDAGYNPVVARDLTELLASLDETTRARWEQYLKSIEGEIAERGPAIAHEHLEAALAHLLAVGWTLHRCFASEDASPVLRPLGDVATTVEDLRAELARLPRKPEWSQ